MEAGGPRRPRRSQEQKAEYLALFERSGKPVAAFCREHGLCEQTFYNWRDRLRGGSGPAVKAGFAEVSGEAASIPSGVCVHLSTGVSLELASGADVIWIGRLLRELRSV